MVAVHLDRAYGYIVGKSERVVVDLVSGAVRQRWFVGFPWLLVDPRAP